MTDSQALGSHSQRYFWYCFKKFLVLINIEVYLKSFLWVSINNLSFIIIAVVWLSLFQLLRIAVWCFKRLKLCLLNVEAQNKINTSIKNIATTKITHILCWEKKKKKTPNTDAGNFLHTILQPIIHILVFQNTQFFKKKYFSSLSSWYNNVHTFILLDQTWTRYAPQNWQMSLGHNDW